MAVRGLAPEKSKLRSDINVTPLIDVCLVLLIVFMLVTPLLMEHREVKLPLADEPERQPEEPRPFPVWIVFADPPGILAGPDARRMDSREFFAALQVLHDSRPATRIAVRADHRLDYGQVKAVMRSIHEAGFANIGLLAEKTDKSEKAGKTKR
ncbi:MAG TPA: biopolymer transporter ExbD [Thermoanaerobaculia bacterium]|nr:biopolymer transporter ExbD [Thermoanaerobaculia bacterium]